MTKWPSGGNIYPVTPKAYPVLPKAYPGTLNAYPGASAVPGPTPVTILASKLAQWIERDLSESSSGGFVTQLNDLSAHAWHHSAAATQQAVDEPGGWNGFRAWAFDGGNDFYTDLNSGAFATALAGGNDPGFAFWAAFQAFALPAGGGVVFSCGAGASTPFLDTGVVSTGFFSTKNSTVSKSLLSPTVDTGRHVLKLVCTGTTAQLSIDGVVVVAFAASNFDTSAATFTKSGFGALLRSTTSAFFTGRMCFFAACAGAPTAGEESDMDVYCAKFTASQSAPMLLINGDSLSTTDKWQVDFAAAYPGATIVNTSVAGQTLFGYGLVWQARDGWSNYDSARSANLLSMQFGSNDIVNAKTGANIYGNTQAYVTAERAKNPSRKIMVATIGWRQGLTGSEETERQAFNTLIRADKAGADYLLDRDVILTAADNATHYADGTHPNALGNTAMWDGRNGAQGIHDYVIAAGF